MNSWLQKLIAAIPLIPYVVMGIQQIHTNAKGETKKQIALQALGLAAGTASGLSQAGVLDESQTKLAALSAQFAGSLIDQQVADNHANNAPGFGANSAPAA